MDMQIQTGQHISMVRSPYCYDAQNTAVACWYAGIVSYLTCQGHSLEEHLVHIRKQIIVHDQQASCIKYCACDVRSLLRQMRGAVVNVQPLLSIHSSIDKGSLPMERLSMHLARVVLRVLLTFSHTQEPQMAQKKGRL